MNFGICKSEVKKFIDGEKVFFGAPKPPFDILIETDFDKVLTTKTKHSTLDQIIFTNSEIEKTIIHFGIHKMDVPNFRSGKAVDFENPFEGHIDFTADLSEVEFTETTVRRILV